MRSLHPYYQVPFYSRIDKGQAIAYPASGMLITFADYLAFALFFSVLGTGLLVSTVVAYIFGLIVSYLLNRFWVFRKGANKQSEGTSLVRYVLFLAFNLALTYGALWAMENWFYISPYIGKILVNIFMFFWIYLGNTLFVFRGIKTGPIEL